MNFKTRKTPISLAGMGNLKIYSIMRQEKNVESGSGSSGDDGNSGDVGRCGSSSGL